MPLVIGLCGHGAGVFTVEVLVLSRHVVGAGRTSGCSVWSPVRLPRVLSCLVLCAVPACLRHRDAVHPPLLRGKLTATQMHIVIIIT